MAERDILFAVRNNFYIGAYNNAINEASDLEGLSDAEAVERDVLVHRAYIALGSHEVRASAARHRAGLRGGGGGGVGRWTAAGRAGATVTAGVVVMSCAMRVVARKRADVSCTTPRPQTHTTPHQHRAQLVISEIGDSAPMALQAVKLLARYLGKQMPKVRGCGFGARGCDSGTPRHGVQASCVCVRACVSVSVWWGPSRQRLAPCADATPRPRHTAPQDEAVEAVGALLADPICNSSPHVLLVGGLVYAAEGNYVEALKACHSGLSLEM
jgi:hypothetical protein